jgi:hypothetical protein
VAGWRRNVTKILLFAAAAAALLESRTAYAGESAKVLTRSLMCSESKYCTAYFADGEVAAGTTCLRKGGTAVRWDVSTPAGAAMLSLLQGAHLARREVIIWDSGCIGEYPKLAWLQVF